MVNASLCALFELYADELSECTKIDAEWNEKALAFRAGVIAQAFEPGVGYFAANRLSRRSYLVGISR